MVVIIRRPHSLLKSPSADSESSDPIQRPLLLKTDSTSSSSMGTMERRRRLIAARYRTDSETTDEQCIPESISETHDSAVESAEDIEEDDKSPNCEAVPPAINLEVQSSTESDKTVLSLRNNSADQLSSVPNSPFGSSIGILVPFSRPKLSLTLPEIIVEPCSPPATSPSAESSPTSATALSDHPGGQVSQSKKESSSSTTSSTSSITLGIFKKSLIY